MTKGITLNHHIAENAVQNVLIVSYSRRIVQLNNGGSKRIQTNAAWHYWGKLKSNVNYCNEYLDDVVGQYYRKLFNSQGRNHCLDSLG